MIRSGERGPHMTCNQLHFKLMRRLPSRLVVDGDQDVKNGHSCCMSVYSRSGVYIIAVKKFRACQLHHALEKLFLVFSLVVIKHGPKPAAPSQQRASLMGI